MIQCLECNKEFKRINIFHLRHHGLTEKSYLQKYPNAKIMDEQYIKNISEKTKESMWTDEVRSKFQEGLKIRRNLSKNLGKYIEKERELKEEEYNAVYTEDRNNQISEKKKEWWSSNKGKTVEELWGEEKGKELRQLKSKMTSGENNPAFGKVYEKSGSCKLGYYKGQLFRGILEYSYLKYMEKQNIIFEYEPFCIDYEFDNVKRTYTPDYLIEQQKQIIEIKPHFYFSEKYFSKEIDAKKQAAEKWCKENGYTYNILTERDFPVMTYSKAYADPYVEWIRK